MRYHGEQPGPWPLAGAQVVCRMWREDRRPLPALLHGALLAHALPEVLLLPGPAGGPGPQLLQQRRHDPLSERLHQVSGGGSPSPLPLPPGAGGRGGQRPSSGLVSAGSSDTAAPAAAAAR